MSWSGRSLGGGGVMGCGGGGSGLERAVNMEGVCEDLCGGSFQSRSGVNTTCQSLYSTGQQVVRKPDPGPSGGLALLVLRVTVTPLLWVCITPLVPHHLLPPV